MKNILLLVLCMLFSRLGAQVPCVNGKSGENDCLGVDLQSHLSPPELGAEELNGRWVNDIWGWVDPETEKEYALVGMTNGTSFVDITDPVNPVVIGVLPEHNSINTEARVLHDDGAKSIWRDIKVYQNYAYVVSEDPDHGIQVFDLTQLRDVSNPSKDNLFDESGHYPGVGQSHNIAINEETGFLYAVGFRQNGDFECNGGGLHIVDLSDPKNPVFAGCFDEDGYTHDAQCVIYRGTDADYAGKEICFNSNEDEVVIVDVSDKDNIHLISKTTYEGVQYTHQGWLSEDHRYFLHNDELDELRDGHNTRTYIWDMHDLDNPKLLDYFEHNQPSIDHNLYTKGRYIYESNYTSGLVILDTVGISDGSLKKAAYFDTYLSNNNASFSGSWSNYPYFPSGNIVVTDISNGLFVVKMQSIFISQQPQDITACVGAHINMPILAGNEHVSYQWQIDQGNGFENISNFERYHSSQTASLHAHALELSQNEYQYRCIVSNGITEIISDPMTIFVIDSPRAEFDYILEDEQGNITFSNTSVNSDTYIWKFGDDSTSEESSPKYRYQESGNYDIALIASNGCTSDTSIVSVDVTVLNPVAGFDFSILDSQGNIGFSNSSIHASSYVWKFGDGNSSTELSPIHQYEENGTYYVELVASGEYTSDTLSLEVSIIILSTKDPSHLIVFPSFANDYITIQSPSKKSFDYSIISLNGDLLQKGSSALEDKTVSLNLPDGIYLVKVETRRESYTQKVIVSH